MYWSAFLAGRICNNPLVFSFSCFFRFPPFNLSFFSFVFASWLNSFPSGSPIQYPLNIIRIGWMMYLRRGVAIEQPTRGGVRRQARRGRESPGGSREEPGKGEVWGMWWEGGRETRERRKIIDFFSPSLLRCEKWRGEGEREGRKERVLWTGRRTTGGFWAVQMRGERS